MSTLAEQFVEDLEDDTRNSESLDNAEHPSGANSKAQGKQTSSDFKEVLELVSEAQDSSEQVGPREYELVNLCMNYLSFVKEEIASIGKKLKKAYGKRFPELETLVSDPVDYARTVFILRNDVDLCRKDLSGVLPQATVITVAVTFASTMGEVLSEDELDEVLELCKEIFYLDEVQKKLVNFVESRMSLLAPNVTVLVGSSIAAQLIGLAGGIENLAKIPSCNIQTLGSNKSLGLGLSTRFTSPHEGYIFRYSEVQSLPYGLRKKGNRLISAKVSLAARVDAAKQSRDGRIGRQLKEEVRQKFEKWQEPPPAKTAKPLPVPDEKPKKRRGGRRLRKQKQLYAVTELRKQQNRLAFGKPEESYGNDIETGFGMIGSGSLHLQSTKTDSVSKAAKRKLEKLRSKEPSLGKKLMSGFQTSLSFASGEGMQLGTLTPAPGGVGVGSLSNQSGIQSTYFSAATPFFGLKK
ncbi:U4/U6 small nuclear ribonucleoprotein PRP31 [Galdieria sulphuraria]|uniref:U4/U6 small nuclear ribonucleoprotein PRP31 n=1 Tax=Galdieria sulphuraria TaxID=130081 RepID=M2XV26_GALSU|nr:U4/U6 small nuclear ribonucleoprotein PRP31 [Galdieria sulphuraria]EME27259.1 U4/U6 small nuclear ribonucleoprotein PRP31 [Galdieria sulphuraria]|eukprot:XP_005703779.1 U4/U6 small nuclear ribonucleoprotein PRP31 [Galdieria sulphuraria]